MDAIASLERKVKELLKKYSVVINDNIRKQSEIEELKKNIAEQKELIKNLEEKNKIIKLAKSLSDSEAKSAEMKHKINEIVREIDKCIAQLNS